MKIATGTLLCLILFSASCSQDDSAEVIKDKLAIPENFSELIETVNLADSVDQFELVDEFFETVSSFPIIETDTDVYFIYTGEASSVAVAGDFNQWNPSGHSLQKLRDTDVWFRKALFESNARLDYKLVINGTNWILDPKNPNSILGGFGANSELAMPAYEQPWEVNEQDGIEKGTIEQTTLTSDFTGKTYTLQVYLPPGYTDSKSYPVAYFQDGSDYLNIASSNVVLDNLIDKGDIEPLIGVFVVPTNRNIEYAFDDRFKYTDFFIQELVPYIDAEYKTITSPQSRAVIGDSYGGNISAIIAFTNPDVFGNCGIHSGAFQPNNFHTNDLVMDGTKKEIRIASIWGTYEGASLPANMRRIKDYLEENNYDITWKELPEGHSWGLWRATLDDMLTFFFPAD